MYVIFPADELIYMTYGPAVYRSHSRPTLDNLREPLVPISHRPQPSKTKTNEPKQIQQLPTSQQPLNSILKSSGSVNLNKSKITESNFEEFNQSQSLDSEIEDSSYSRNLDKLDQQSRSSSIYFDTTNSTANSQTPSAGKRTTGKLKSKSRLNLSLGLLGKQSTAELTDTARIKEEHHVLVENPTFTRENLRQRNYDAFFESGASVYSIKTRQLSQPDSEPSPSPLPLPQHTLTPSELNHKPPPIASLLRRSKSPTASIKIQLPQPNKQYSSTSNRNSRGKSVEFNLEPPNTPEVCQKETHSKIQRNLFGWKSSSKGVREKMANSTGILKDLCHHSYNESLKIHNGVTFKLVKTVSDFTETLSQLYEQHAEALQMLVSTYRKKNGELRKERPACHSSLFQAWETFLQEIEADSQSTSDVASSLSRQVARPLLERSFYRKVQSRKVFTHRESFETIIAKTEEKLSKCRMEYKQCYMTHRQNPTQLSLAQYIDSHNAYIQQLHATNAMLEAYNCETVPQLLQELEEIYSDLCNIVAEAVAQGAEAISNKAVEQSKRYDGLASTCKSVSGLQDLTNLIRVLPVVPNAQKIPKKMFAPPQPPVVDGEEVPDYNDTTPIFKNELVLDRCASIQPRAALEVLKRESQELDIQIRQLQDSIDALTRGQSRGLDSQLYNKANEVQEDISMKKFDLRAKQIHLAAVKAQKELFLGKNDPGSPRTERKLSSSSSSSMKTKWLKAFRSLKPAGAAPSSDKKNGAAAAAALAQIRAGDTESHNLQEYTYKKITPCDVCGQVLRGHTRQGLRCRICKTNAHADCAPQLTRCSAKQKLLRRQKSTSEIENQVDQEEEREGPSLLSRHLSREPCDIDGVGTTRPFGQPLCLVAEDPIEEKDTQPKKPTKKKR